MLALKVLRRDITGLGIVSPAKIRELSAFLKRVEKSHR